MQYKVLIFYKKIENRVVSSVEAGGTGPAKGKKRGAAEGVGSVGGESGEADGGRRGQEKRPEGCKRAHREAEKRPFEISHRMRSSQRACTGFIVQHRRSVAPHLTTSSSLVFATRR